MRRQAVQIEDPHLAALLVAWQAAMTRRSPLGPLFPTVATLRLTFNRAVDALGDDTWETRGLRLFGTVYVTVAHHELICVEARSSCPIS